LCARTEEKAKLQEIMHTQLQLRNTAQCDEEAKQQEAAIRHIYTATSEAQTEGRAAFTAIPRNAFTKFSSQQVQLTWCKQFGLPLPGIKYGSYLCPGCKAPIDDYGVHLLNCPKISTKTTAEPYSKHLLHNHIAEKLCAIASNKFYCVGTNPRGERNCPLLEDGKTIGRLDLQFDQRDGSMIRTLGDVSVGNPLSEKKMSGEVPSLRDAISDIRADKNKKYRKPIASLAKFGQTQLAVYAFTSYGLFSSEVHDLLWEVAQHVSDKSTTTINATRLYNTYKKELACVLHKGVAKVLASRIELLRVSSNQVRQQIYDIRDLAMMQLNEALEDRQNEG